MHTVQDVQGWQGRTLVDADGDKIGKVEDIYLDRQSGDPEWVAVKTGLFGTRVSFVPIRDATATGDEVRVAHSKDKVKDAPNIEADGELSPDEERVLYEHYGREDYGDWTHESEDRSERGLGLEARGDDRSTGEAGTTETGTADTGTAAAGTTDAANTGTAETGTTGTTETGTAETGTTGTAETGTADARTTDTGTTGTADTGTTETGAGSGTTAAGPTGVAADERDGESYGREGVSGQETGREGVGGGGAAGETSGREGDAGQAGAPGTTAAAAGGAAAGAAAGQAGDDAMTRSEEELAVGTQRRETGRARLRKFVVTEDVKETVPVQREELRVEREPITDDNIEQATQGPDISEAEHEITLHAEEPVAEKQTVPKERVRLDKDVHTGEQTVADEVRKERIEREGDVRDRT
jgi:uncharacterized protein (TIGR02271 family)